MEDMIWKYKIFDDWFEKRTLHYKEQRNGKFCDTEIVIKHNAFVRTFNGCYKRFFKHYTERNECFCDCIMLVWEALNQFRIMGDSCWEWIATGSDKKNYGKLVTYVKNYVVYELERKLYPKVCTSKTVHIDGEKKQFLVYYNIEPESLNRLTSWKDETEKVELINCMEESYWTPTEDYQQSLFVNWAKDNIRNVLTDKQIEFLKTLRDANYSKLDKDYDEELIGLTQNSIRQRLKRIYDRITKEYSKAKKFYTGGFVIQSLNAEMKVLTKITNNVYRNDIEPQEMNARVSKQILRSMNNTHFEKLLYDKLDEKSLKVIIRIYSYSMIADEKDFQLFADEIQIPSKILYKIVGIVEDRIETLERRIEKEIAILDKQAEKEEVKVELVQFPIDPKKTCIHLKMNAYGIAVPKYE